MDIERNWTNTNPKFKKPFYLFTSYLAKQYVKLYSTESFVGVTGSLGRSTCVEACTAVLSQKFKTIKTAQSSFNIPSTLLKMAPSIKKVVLEMGIDFQGDSNFYLSLVTPKIIVVNKLADSNGHILDEISKLIEKLPADGVAILNWDDPNSKKLAEKCRGSVIYYGTDQKNCTIWAGNIKIEDFRTNFELNLGVERVKVNLQLLGSHQVYPVLAAAALGVLHQISLTKIKLSLESVAPQEHKLQALFGPSGSILLDDTVEDCTLTSLEAALDVISQIPARRRVLVLGEIKDSDEKSEAFSRLAAQIIFKEKVDQIYLGTGNTSIIIDELKSLGFWEEKVFVNLQNSQLVSKLLKNLNKGDVCLIKGSKSLRFDEVVKRVAKK